MLHITPVGEGDDQLRPLRHRVLGCWCKRVVQCARAVLALQIAGWRAHGITTALQGEEY